MNAARVTAAIVVTALALAAVLPVSAAVAPDEALRARLVSAGLSLAVAAAIAAIRGIRRTAWAVAAVTLLIAGTALLVVPAFSGGACVASFDGRPVVIGRELTAAGAEYLRAHPGLGARDLLLDAGGAVDRLWTPDSIAACRFWTGWAGLLAVPMFTGAVCAAFVAKGLTLGAAPRPGPPAGAAPPMVYDAFLSYRHVDPDRTYAEELVRLVEAQGLRAAIDVRDFAPNRHFLSEMERCIKQSRFTLCVVTSRYLESDHTGEEAVIAKTLDLADRTKRVVPLVYERVPLPVWLHGLSGIDFTEAARVDPQDRLLALLRADDRAARP